MTAMPVFMLKVSHEMWFYIYAIKHFLFNIKLDITHIDKVTWKQRKFPIFRVLFNSEAMCAKKCIVSK